MKTNSMLALKALVKRHISIFLKDKTFVLFSFMAPVVVFLIYVLFLGELQAKDIFEQVQAKAIELGITMSTKEMQNFARAIVDNWMISGVLATSCISVAFNANAIMVRDKEHGAINDVLASPVKRWVVIMSYVLSCFLISLIICATVLIVSFIYLACTGGFMMSFVDFLAIVGITILSCLSAAIIAVFLATFLKTQSALTSVTSVLSILIGFVTGAYLPVNMMPVMKYVTCFIPGSYSVGLFRQYLLKGPLNKLEQAIGNPDLIEKLRQDFSIEMEFFGHPIKWGWMVFALVISTIIIGAIMILYYYRKKGNVYLHRVKNKKKR